jgi:undecaprenyl-diphosphatase
VTTYFAVRFLLRYFETHRLIPFGTYCIAAGTLSSLVLLLGR